MYLHNEQEESSLSNVQSKESLEHDFKFQKEIPAINESSIHENKIQNNKIYNFESKEIEGEFDPNKRISKENYQKQLFNANKERGKKSKYIYEAYKQENSEKHPFYKENYLEKGQSRDGYSKNRRNKNKNKVMESSNEEYKEKNKQNRDEFGSHKAYSGRDTAGL